MKLTHFGHSCVLLEAADQRVLVDPGGFSDTWHALTDLDAIVVTHQHPDHLDLTRLPQLLRANPGVRLWAEPDSCVQLRDAHFDVTEFRGGDTISLGEVRLDGVGDKHAIIHADLPRIGNTGLLITDPMGVTFYHPGDALDAELPTVDLLGVPINAPWCAMKETIEFVRRINPGRLLPIHDGLLNHRGRQLYTTQIEKLGQVEVWRIEPETACKVPERIPG